MSFQTTEEIKLTESLISNHKCLIEIRDYLKCHKFTTMPNSYQPPWFTNIRRILNQAGYKF